jgi:hypothetical protein
VNQTGAGGTEQLNYRFVFTGTYYLILDSDGAESSGSWFMNATLTCPSQVPNDVCPSAIFLNCGPINLAGSTEHALDNYDLPQTGCTGFTTLGPDVVYRIDANGADSLWLDYQSTADASVYLLTDCSNMSSCVAGWDINGTGEAEHVRYKVPARGTYYLILDSYEYQVWGTWTAIGAIVCRTGVAGVGDRAAEFRIRDVVPNPFAQSSNLRFTLGERGHAVLRIYDLAGRVVRTLADGELGAGEHSVRWDARDDHGVPVGAGTYYARLAYGGRVAYRTMVFVR